MKGGGGAMGSMPRVDGALRRLLGIPDRCPSPLHSRPRSLVTVALPPHREPYSSSCEWFAEAIEYRFHRVIVLLGWRFFVFVSSLFFDDNEGSRASHTHRYCHR
jgi:hypothetical protein